MTEHASVRAYERHGEKMTAADKREIMARIDAGLTAEIRNANPKRDKLPIHLALWPRVGKTCFVVINPERKRIVTVLPDDCGEVQWRMARLFGR